MEVETRDWRHFRGQHSVATVMGGRLRHGPSDWPTPPGVISVHDAERGESAKGAGVSGAAGRVGTAGARLPATGVNIRPGRRRRRGLERS